MPPSLIHVTALVDPKAELDSSVRVGPYTTVGAHVQVGANTTIAAHCVIEGHTVIGKDNHIFQFNSIGAAPQDKKYAGEPTALQIGNGNTIREFCSIHLGTAQDTGTTRIGDDNWIMNCVHIAHDCVVGNHNIFGGYVGLAGHVHVDDWCTIGSYAGMHQFTRFGSHAMAGFNSHISQDVPPFMMVDGNPLSVRGYNKEGLRRRGYSAERIAGIKTIYKLLYRQGLTLDAAKAAIAALSNAHPDSDADVALILNFLATASRGIAR